MKYWLYGAALGIVLFCGFLFWAAENVGPRCMGLGGGCGVATFR